MGTIKDVNEIEHLLKTAQHDAERGRRRNNAVADVLSALRQLKGTEIEEAVREVIRVLTHAVLEPDLWENCLEEQRALEDLAVELGEETWEDTPSLAREAVRVIRELRGTQDNVKLEWTGDASEVVAWHSNGIDMAACCEIAPDGSWMVEVWHPDSPTGAPRGRTANGLGSMEEAKAWAEAQPELRSLLLRAGIPIPQYKVEQLWVRNVRSYDQVGSYHLYHMTGNRLYLTAALVQPDGDGLWEARTWYPAETPTESMDIRKKGFRTPEAAKAWAERSPDVEPLLKYYDIKLEDSDG